MAQVSRTIILYTPDLSGGRHDIADGAALPELPQSPARFGLGTESRHELGDDLSTGCDHDFLAILNPPEIGGQTTPKIRDIDLGHDDPPLLYVSSVQKSTR
jgi:hypothetical protein